MEWKSLTRIPGSAARNALFFNVQTFQAAAREGCIKVRGGYGELRMRIPCQSAESPGIWNVPARARFASRW
jgi:hypothetical protein